MSTSSVVVGIDVAKAHIDVVVLGAPWDTQRFANEANAHEELAGRLQQMHAELVVMEATGGYEAALACALQAAGLAVVVINPRQARDFARPRRTPLTRACWPSWRLFCCGERIWPACCVR
jgi:transposase